MQWTVSKAYTRSGAPEASQPERQAFIGRDRGGREAALVSCKRVVCAKEVYKSIQGTIAAPGHSGPRAHHRQLPDLGGRGALTATGAALVARGRVGAEHVREGHDARVDVTDALEGALTAESGSG